MEDVQIVVMFINGSCKFVDFYIFSSDTARALFVLQDIDSMHSRPPISTSTLVKFFGFINDVL